MSTGFIDETINQAIEMLETGAPRRTILTHLVNAAETLAESEAVSSILLLDDKGLLRNGASPKLPHDYLAAIDGLKPHPKVGTCAAAAQRSVAKPWPNFALRSPYASTQHVAQPRRNSAWRN